MNSSTSVTRTRTETARPGLRPGAGRAAPVGTVPAAPVGTTRTMSFAGTLAAAQRIATTRSAASTASAAPGALNLPGNLGGIVAQAAQRYGVDPALIAGVIETESNFNPNAVSPAGARGLMQLMPGTARGLGVGDSSDPLQNVMGGAKLLGQLLDKYGGDVKKALAAYNAGPGAVDKYGGIPPYPETQRYVPKVLAATERYRSSQESGVRSQ